MRILILVCFCICISPAAFAQIIRTVAGNGTPAFAGDNGRDTLASLYYPSGMTIARNGDLYIADYGNHRIRKVNQSNHQITTVAGNGNAGASGDQGPAINARLNYPASVAVDDSGNVFIADMYNSRIRKITLADNMITTIAGTGVAGYNGDSILAIAAQLNFPTDVTLDRAGNIYIADQRNHRIRKIDRQTGQITTIAGDGTAGATGDGGLATRASLHSPAGICLDPDGNLVIADQENNCVRKVSAISGTISRIAGMYGGIGFVFSGDGGPAINAQLFYPVAVNADTAGNIYIADSWNNAIRKITASTRIIETIAGRGGFFNSNFGGDYGPATSCYLNKPSGLSVDAIGDVYIADYSNHRVRKLEYPCVPRTFVFNGNGNGKWSDGANWENKRKPPPALPACDEIIVRYTQANQRCILDTRQIILPGGRLTVTTGCKLEVPLEIAVQ